MPVLRDLLRNPFLEQEPDCRSSAEQTPRGHGEDPDIEEAGCEVPSHKTYGAPSLAVTA
jgi:hypothetical protein